MRRLLNNTTIVILALILPVAALANVMGTQTLSSGQTFSFDSGTVVASGGDTLWTGSGITPQGSATVVNLSADGLTGASSFSELTQSTLSAFASLYSSSAIPLSGLAVNNIFAVHTNGGNYGAALVTAQSGTSITLQFITFISTVPTISQVLNNYGLIPAGFNNSGIAPGTLFIIKGSLLASATVISSLQSTTGGSTLPTTLNGSSVSVTVNGTTTHPGLYYAGCQNVNNVCTGQATQLAMVLPSNTPVGAGTVTVTYNGQTSAPFNVQVAASAFGFAAAYGTGSGLAHAQDLSYNPYTYNISVPPGSTVRLIGSGLGADPTRDTQYVQPTAASAINALAHVYVGGIDSPIFYQGPEGYPGVDEVDVTIPSNVPTGCFISVVGVSTAGVTTNFLTLPIGTGQCEDTGLGFSGSLLTTLSLQSTVRTGFVEMVYNTSPATSGSGTMVNTEAAANFQSYTGSVYGAGSGIVSIGGCTVNENLVSTGGSTGTSTPLSAGTIVVTGPNGPPPVTLMAEGASLPGYYSDMLPTGFLTMSGGSFMFQAAAGTQVGAFTTSVNFPIPLLQWTNQAAAATVTRSAGLPITWTGGSAGTYVIISGTSSNASVSGYFNCLAPVAAGQFTVPSYVLGTLPASTVGGSLSVANETVPQSFSATGLDYGFAIGLESTSISATYN